MAGLWETTIKGQFELLDMSMARVLHGYLLRDHYMWLYSGEGYSGVIVATGPIEISQAISRAIKPATEYGYTLNVTIDKNHDSMFLDVNGCGAYKGKFIHYVDFLQAVIPNNDSTTPFNTVK